MPQNCPDSPHGPKALVFRTVPSYISTMNQRPYVYAVVLEGLNSHIVKCDRADQSYIQFPNFTAAKCYLRLYVEEQKVLWTQKYKRTIKLTESDTHFGL